MRVGRHTRAILTVLNDEPCNMRKLKSLLPESSKPVASVYISRLVGRGFVANVKHGKRYIYYITQAGEDALQAPLEKVKPKKPVEIPSVTSVWSLGIDK